MITIKKIEEARQRLNGIIRATPMAYAPILSKKYNAKIYLKKENLQLTGSFKLRGAFNKIATLKEIDRKKGVVAASAGNHAQGVAYSAGISVLPTKPSIPILFILSFTASVVILEFTTTGI